MDCRAVPNSDEEPAAANKASPKCCSQVASSPVVAPNPVVECVSKGKWGQMGPVPPSEIECEEKEGPGTSVEEPTVGSDSIQLAGTNIGGDGDTQFVCQAESKSAAPHGDGSRNFKLVSQLNDATIGRWSLKARVLAKTPVRSFDSGESSGKVFSAQLVDRDGGEIRATVFGAAISLLEPLLLCGSVVLVSHAKIRRTKRKFAMENQPFQLILNEDTIVRTQTDDGSIPRNSYNFRPIDSLRNLDADTFVDVVGIVSHVEDLRTFPETCLRNISIVDTTNTEVRCVFWRDAAHDAADTWVGKVCAIKSARISRRDGVELATVMTTSYAVQPDIPEAIVLIDWYRQNLNQIPKLQEQFPWCTVDQVLTSEVGVFVNVIATIKSLGEVKTRNGGASKYRELRLIDNTKAEVCCTLWGAFATRLADEHKTRTIALQGCRVTEYQGKKLASSSRTSITLDPRSSLVDKNK